MKRMTEQKTENIVLIGFMGTGKSAVGRALARRLGARHLDTDAEIEREAGRTIPEIFAAEGEAAFRAREAALLTSLAEQKSETPLILSTGGGTPLRPENAARLAQIGIVVWLQVAPEAILARVSRSLHERPLLHAHAADPLTRIKTLLAERGPRYASLAAYTLDTSGCRDAEEAAVRVLEMLDMKSETYMVPVEMAERSYQILVERGALAAVGTEMARHLADDGVGDRLALVVTSPEIDALYGNTLRQSLTAAGFRVATANVPPGEDTKSLAHLETLYTALHAEAADRRTAVVALGGGVIGDLAGFAAATYVRGLDFVQVPTTLLAQVDSSVGGKTGVNFQHAKNILGAFHQPRLVIIDPDTLATLSLRERRSGMAEVIKYGIIADKSFFGLLSREMHGLLDLTSPELGYVLARSCALKARVVEQDEREGGLRAILNFGHTVGHALETLTHYQSYTHGEAIALGMVSAALIGEEVGVTRPEDTRAVTALLQAAGFAVALDPAHSLDEIVRLLAWDKKSVGGTARFVLMEALGHATPGHVVPEAAIRAALARQQSLHTEAEVEGLKTPR